MRTRELNTSRLLALRGKRSREVIAHELRKKGHGTDAKSIWRYETGRSQPNARVLFDYADVLGAETVDALYADDDAEAALLRDVKQSGASLLETLYAEIGHALGKNEVAA